MEFGKIGSFGGLFLAGYLLFLGFGLLFGITAIPSWFLGLLATAAGILILIGK